MTPKEKAEALFDKYINASFNCKGCDMPYCDIKCTMLNKMEAKECALIAVNEMINNAGYIWGGRDSETGLSARDGYRAYWKEVKQEIEKL